MTVQGPVKKLPPDGMPHRARPPPPPREGSALAGATVGVISATFGTVSYFAFYKYAPVSEQWRGVLHSRSPAPHLSQFSEPALLPATQRADHRPTDPQVEDALLKRRARTYPRTYPPAE